MFTDKNRQLEGVFEDTSYSSNSESFGVPSVVN
jgi:hypothetical protein